MKINPSLIVLIDCPDQIVINRLTKRRTDPLTGQVYDDIELVEDPEIKKRLSVSPNESEAVVRLRYLIQIYSDLSVGKNS